MSILQNLLNKRFAHTTEKFLNEQFAQSAAKLLKLVCYFLIGLDILCIILSFMGRQTFYLHTDTGTFPRAIYAESDHDFHTRGMTVHMGDDVHVWTNAGGQIDLAVHIALSFMYAAQMVPMALAFWFLSRLLSNIQSGRIFMEQNAVYLLYYGALQFFVAAFVPFIKLLICALANLVSNGCMSIATGQDAVGLLIPAIAFIVAAYIIHYGVHLQDEVDHTL